MKTLLKYGLLMVLCGVSSIIVENRQAIANDSPSQSNRYGSTLKYPVGTRIYPNGTISTPRSGVIFPSVTIQRGDGSTTFHYRNGTSITTKNNNINPGGTYLTPAINGGLRNDTPRNLNPFIRNR